MVTIERLKTLRLTKLTLGVVGVVWVLVADAPNFEGAKGAKFRRKPPFCLFQNKVGCPPVRTRNLNENHFTFS